MEVKFHFGPQRDKNDLQKVDDRLLFYALENCKDQVKPLWSFFLSSFSRPSLVAETNFPS